MTVLKETYKSDIVPKLKEAFGLENAMRIPRISKVVVNMGFGVADKDTVKTNADNLGLITGQKAIVIEAKKSISNFKLREGMQIGAKVTLRGDRMYEFLDRLINAALPRIRDFRGIPSNSFDGRGNFSLGIKELEIFPEIDPNGPGTSQGLDITIVTNTDEDKEAFELLKLLGMPFEKK
ncbi:50S ribosomal protein L5 [bacterium E08(2017)]|nr:50S ribosomal protein L5 [bacterium E08(2017)]